MDKAERMERNARFCYRAGAFFLGASVALLFPDASGTVVEYVHAVAGALIEAFMDSPFSAY